VAETDSVEIISKTMVKDKAINSGNNRSLMDKNGGGEY
jgi:hypothetical protein